MPKYVEPIYAVIETDDVVVVADRISGKFYMKIRTFKQPLHAGKTSIPPDKVWSRFAEISKENLIPILIERYPASNPYDLIKNGQPIEPKTNTKDNEVHWTCGGKYLELRIVQSGQRVSFSVLKQLYRETEFCPWETKTKTFKSSNGFEITSVSYPAISRPRKIFVQGDTHDIDCDIARCYYPDVESASKFVADLIFATREYNEKMAAIMEKPKNREYRKSDQNKYLDIWIEKIGPKVSFRVIRQTYRSYNFAETSDCFTASNGFSISSMAYPAISMGCLNKIYVRGGTTEGDNDVSTRVFSSDDLASKFMDDLIFAVEEYNKKITKILPAKEEKQYLTLEITRNLCEIRVKVLHQEYIGEKFNPSTSSGAFKATTGVAIMSGMYPAIYTYPRVEVFVRGIEKQSDNNICVAKFNTTNDAVAFETSLRASVKEYNEFMRKYKTQQKPIDNPRKFLDLDIVQYGCKVGITVTKQLYINGDFFRSHRLNEERDVFFASNGFMLRSCACPDIATAYRLWVRGNNHEHDHKETMFTFDSQNYAETYVAKLNEAVDEYNMWMQYYEDVANDDGNGPMPVMKPIRRRT